MRQRHMDHHIGKVLGDLTGQSHLGPTPHIGDHLDIAVNGLRQHRTLGEPRARPCFDDGLFGGPAGSQVASGHRTLVGSITAFAGGKRLSEHRPGLIDLLGEIGNEHQIDPHANYRHGIKLAEVGAVVAQARGRIEQHGRLLRLLRRVMAESTIGGPFVHRFTAGNGRRQSALARQHPGIRPV